MAEASDASNFIHHNNNSANIKSETSSNSGSLPSKKLSLNSSVKQTPNNNYKQSQQLGESFIKICKSYQFYWEEKNKKRKRTGLNVN